MFAANLVAGWAGILVGMLVGAGIGTGFHRAGYLGGYDGWPRRLVRLGHVSFFGLGFVNIGCALSAPRFAASSDASVAVSGGAASQLLASQLPASQLLASQFPAPGLAATASALLIAGAVLMPTVCFLAAWRRGLRHFFFLPVASLVLGVGAFLTWGILGWTSA